MPRTPARSTIACLALLAAATLCAGAPTPGLGAAAASTAGLQALPKAEDLFAKYVEALGGEKAVRSVTHRITDGILEKKDTGFMARVTIWQEAPNKMRVVLEQPGVVTLEFGFDGTTAWSVDSRRGGRVMQGNERDQTMDSALFLGDADYKARYKAVETVEEATFNGKPAYKVRCTPIYGAEQSFVFFDPQTGLISGTENDPKPGADGKAPPKTVTLISDYKKFGEMFFPTKISQGEPGKEPLVTTYREIEVNPAEKPEITAPKIEAPAAPADPTPKK